MKTLYIVRGVPGSGKSTTAKKLAHFVCEADDFFIDEHGVYNFDLSKLKNAHEYCRLMCEHYMININSLADTMDSDMMSVAVANTFTRKWEMAPYYELAEKHGFSVVEIICRGNFKNIHGVPEKKVEEMLRRFEY